MLDTSNADTGVPRLLKRPNAAGAYPPRDNEKSIRDIRYKLQFTLESAAISTTKFITPAAAGAESLSCRYLYHLNERTVKREARLYRAIAMPCHGISYNFRSGGKTLKAPPRRKS